MGEELVVTLSCDDNYAAIMSVTIVSILESNKEFKKIKVYCLLYKVSDEKIDAISKIGAKYQREIICIDVKSYCEKYRFWEEKEDSRYCRLILPYIINEDKVLYLDCDILVRKSLKQLWQLNIEQYAQAAVLDTVRSEARKEAFIGEKDSYFNSGVLLINLAYWRTHNVVDEFKRFKKINNNKGIYRDQRVINGVLAKETLILPPIYNFTPEMEKFSSKQIMELTGMETFYSLDKLQEANSDPYIVHFAGRTIDRPWFRNCEHKYKNEYRIMMKKEVFTDFELKQDKFSNVLKWWVRKRLPFPLLLILSRISNSYAVKKNQKDCSN